MNQLTSSFHNDSDFNRINILTERLSDNAIKSLQIDKIEALDMQTTTGYKSRFILMLIQYTSGCFDKQNSKAFTKLETINESIFHLNEENLLIKVIFPVVINSYL